MFLLNLLRGYIIIIFARLIAMKAGGQNLDELTKFCKELAKKVKLVIADVILSKFSRLGYLT